MNTPDTCDLRKTCHALAYLVGGSTGLCERTTLFRLLYLLDLRHLERYGRTVTGLEYAAWGRGPVPVLLWNHWKERSAEFSAYFGIEARRGPEGQMTERLVPLETFDETLFSRSELDLLHEIVATHAGDDARRLSETAYFERDPWQETWSRKGDRGAAISLSIALPRRQSEGDRAMHALALLHRRVQQQLHR